MDSSEKTQPEAEFRINGVKAVVWRNDTRNGHMFNTTLIRVYKDAEDEWRETHSLGRDDLLAAGYALAVLEIFESFSFGYRMFQ